MQSAFSVVFYYCFCYLQHFENPWTMLVFQFCCTVDSNITLLIVLCNFFNHPFSLVLTGLVSPPKSFGYWWSLVFHKLNMAFMIPNPQ